jgi:putative nucleotidyltransferase-like protein
MSRVSSTSAKPRASRPGPPSRAAVLCTLDAMIDRARAPADLEHHGLHLLAAHRFRTLGRPVSNRLIAYERSVATISLATPAVLKRIRAAYDGDLMLFKGPEVAAVYPDPALRPYSDIDLLASDARAAQAALIAAGFEPLGDERRYAVLHHLRPLRLPGLPLLVEVHHAPKWPQGHEPPSTRELLEAAIPARCGVAGILGLPPAYHAVLLSAHAWAHAPLKHLRHLVDVALVAADIEPSDCARLAERWGASHFWEATVAALNGLFGGARSPATLRLWARHLAPVRERTVFEKHLTAWLSPLWSFPRSSGLRECAAAFVADLRPLRGEDWRDKLVRTRLALANASLGASQHDALLHELGLDRDPTDAAREA